MDNCRNCGVLFSGNFCHDCGQKKIEDRIKFKQVFKSAFTNIFNIDRGFFFTAGELFKNPGNVITSYLRGGTKKYFNPLSFMFIIATISLLASNFLNVFELQMDSSMDIYRKMGYTEEMIENSKKVFPVIKQFLNLISLMIIPFLAIGLKLMFSSKKMYIGEMAVISCYGLGLSSIIAFPFLILYYFYPGLAVYSLQFTFLITSLVLGYVLSSFFKTNYFTAALLGFGAYIIGFLIMLLSLGIVSIILGIIIAIIWSVFR